MLTYNQQYNILNGIFLTFKNNSSKRLLTVNHTDNKRDKMKILFPYLKYESFAKENFIVVCLYIMYKFNPSSVNKTLDILREIDFDKTVVPFKNSISQYKSNVIQNVMSMREKYGKPTMSDMFKEYKKGNIKFFTLYFYMKKNGYDIDETIKTQGHLVAYHLRQIRQLMLYITFRQTAIDSILGVFEEESEIFAIKEGLKN